MDAPPMPAGARVSVILAVRDEAAHLASAVASVLAQDGAEGVENLECVVAVAPSLDDTAAIAASLSSDDPRVRVIDNPAGTTPAGLNAAIAASTGDVIVRVDGHAALPPDYIARAVGLLDETGADNVGGIMAAEGHNAFERAVAAAMSSRFGTGDARFHYGGAPGPVDTVYLGVFRRAALERVGGYDETLLRTQDAELNHRIRASGGMVYFHPDLRVRYRPRGTVAALARQYFDYGRWRRVVVRRHPRSLRWRQLVAPATLIASVAGAATALAGRRAGLLAPGLYVAGLGGASVLAGRGLPLPVALRLPVVFATMHGSWALGFLTSPRALGGRRVSPGLTQVEDRDRRTHPTDGAHQRHVPQPPLG